MITSLFQITEWELAVWLGSTLAAEGQRHADQRNGYQEPQHQGVPGMPQGGARRFARAGISGLQPPGRADGDTAWMWQPCRTSDMNAASTLYVRRDGGYH
jgi:hypothetical protein